MRTYQLAATGISASSSVTITLPQSGTIVGVDWAIRTTSGTPANQDSFTATLAVNQATDPFGTNDAIGVVTACTSSSRFTTSGDGQSSVTKWAGPMAVAVLAGDKLYLHYTEVGGCTWAVQCIVHIK